MSILSAIPRSVRLEVIKGDTLPAIRVIVAEEGRDFSSYTAKCEFRSAAGAYVLTLAPTATNSVGSMFFDLALTKAQTATLTAGEAYSWDAEISSADASTIQTVARGTLVVTDGVTRSA